MVNDVPMLGSPSAKTSLAKRNPYSHWWSGAVSPKQTQSARGQAPGRRASGRQSHAPWYSAQSVSARSENISALPQLTTAAKASSKPQPVSRGLNLDLKTAQGSSTTSFSSSSSSNKLPYSSSSSATPNNVQSRAVEMALPPLDSATSRTDPVHPVDYVEKSVTHSQGGRCLRKSVSTRAGRVLGGPSSTLHGVHPIMRDGTDAEKHSPRNVEHEHEHMSKVVEDVQEAKATKTTDNNTSADILLESSATPRYSQEQVGLVRDAVSDIILHDISARLLPDGETVEYSSSSSAVYNPEEGAVDELAALVRSVTPPPPTIELKRRVSQSIGDMLQSSLAQLITDDQ